jgi:hypothetical protein
MPHAAENGPRKPGQGPRQTRSHRSRRAPLALCRRPVPMTPRVPYEFDTLALSSADCASRLYRWIRTAPDTPGASRPPSQAKATLLSDPPCFERCKRCRIDRAYHNVDAGHGEPVCPNLAAVPDDFVGRVACRAPSIHRRAEFCSPTGARPEASGRDHTASSCASVWILCALYQSA